MKKIFLSMGIAISSMFLLAGLAMDASNLEYYLEELKEVKKIESLLPVEKGDWDQYDSILDEGAILPSEVKNGIQDSMYSLYESGGMSCKLVVIGEEDDLSGTTKDQWTCMEGSEGDLLLVVKIGKNSLEYEQRCGLDVQGVLQATRSWKYSLESMSRYYQSSGDLSELKWLYVDLERYVTDPRYAVGLEYSLDELVISLVFTMIALLVDVLLIVSLVRHDKKTKVNREVMTVQGMVQPEQCRPPMQTVQERQSHVKDLDQMMKRLPLRTNNGTAVTSIRSGHPLSMYVQEVINGGK